MWMMGCRDSAGLQTSDSFSGKKLRPLIPRPTTLSSSSSTTSVTATTTCFSRIHSNDLFALHNHLGAVEQGKRDACNHPVSSRWNPTPEQLHTLEELYRRGTRTPSAEQIQHITAQLRRYGKIEGKNVFYWFQNHKARDRQKLRRSLFRQKQQQQQQQHQPRLLQQQPIAETSSLSLSSENPPHFLHQGRVEEAAQAMNFGCKLDSLDMKDKEKPSMDYGHDSMMMMMDMGSDPSYRPLKTLELFPIKSTGSTSTD